MIINELDYIKQELIKNIPFEINNVGKQIRSAISLLLLKSTNIKITEDILNILTATELIHNASLLHDDIIDMTSVRRNTPSVREIKGDKISLLYGNLTLTNAISILLKLNSTQITDIFNKTINNMCKGELLQQEELYKIPSLDNYIIKTKLKTAELFTAPLKAISLTADIPQEFISFANCFGTAFQINNDLDNFLNAKTDAEQGIYTAPFILEQNLHPTNNAIEKTLSLIDNYIKEGVNYLDIIPDSDYRQELIRKAECLKRLKTNIMNLG